MSRSGSKTPGENGGGIWSRGGRNDHAGRLRKDDLLLISQNTDDTAEIHVVRIRRGLYPARRIDEGVWQRVAEKATVRDDLEIVGHVMGIVWAALLARCVSQDIGLPGCVAAARMRMTERQLDSRGMPRLFVPIVSAFNQFDVCPVG